MVYPISMFSRNLLREVKFGIIVIDTTNSDSLASCGEPLSRGTLQPIIYLVRSLVSYFRELCMWMQ